MTTAAHPPAPLTVVVLTYNSGRTIDACLDSLAAQEQPPDEIIVVDDESTDDTPGRVAAFAERRAIAVRVLPNGSHNISRGRNIGLRAARNQLVAFLDSDAWADPGWIRALVAAFEGNTRNAVVGGEVVAAHATPFAEAIALNDTTVRELATSGSLLIGGCNMAIHKGRCAGELFNELWVHAEDIEFVTRVSRRAQWTVVPSARVWHESRATVRGYLRQMYRYGLWKARYTLRTGQIRAVDYVPTAVLVVSALLGALLSPLWLLAYPAMSVAETVFVVGYRRPPARMVPLLLLGWLVKNSGWGSGVLVALLQQVVGRSGAPHVDTDPVGAAN